ncbi:MAG: Lrp/AsnC family transcriptional regulator [Bacteroidales bacterium]|nr:Lrp/AsnC family transcriptional regulator [Bacteroidales bacterium]
MASTNNTYPRGARDGIALDETDIKILRCLQQDARLTIKEIANQVDLSTTPVFERIKRMEREGFIKRYVTVLDAEKIHRGFIVFCSVKLSPLNQKVAHDFCDIVSKIPEVTECYNISGRYDYLLKVHAPDMKYYQEFVLNVLGQLPMLGSLESTFVMEEIKNDFGVAI